MTTKPDITVAEASGMLDAIRKDHTCTEACHGTTTLGDGTVIQLRCPWANLEPRNREDRAIIAGVYASEARAALAHHD